MSRPIEVGAEPELPTCRTPTEHVEAMKSMCETLAGRGVESAVVDDWGFFSNFQVVVRMRAGSRLGGARLKALIERSLPDGAHVRAVTARRLRPAKRGDVRAGSNRAWFVDIDFQKYDPQSNTFLQIARG